MCAVHTEAESARLATVLQENTVLKSELDMVKLKYKNIAEENRRLRQASVNIVSRSTHKGVLSCTCTGHARLSVVKDVSRVLNACLDNRENGGCVWGGRCVG